MNEADPDERFTQAILNFCAGKSYAQRMHTIAAILAAFGNLEAAGYNQIAARLLFEASQQIELLGKAGHGSDEADG